MQIDFDKITTKTNLGEDLGTLLRNEKVMLVFLRHFGCTFCRETLADLEKLRFKLEYAGVKIILVHMMSEEYASLIFNIYDLSEISHVSDPDQKLYSHFQLKKGSFRQLFGFKVLIKAIWAGLVKGHMIGKLRGDGFQMPGVFVFEKGKISNSFIHNLACDRPDYLKLTKLNATT